MPVFTPIPHDAVVAAILTLRDAIAAGDWRPDTIVGIGRGGLVPAVYLSPVSYTHLTLPTKA